MSDILNVIVVMFCFWLIVLGFALVIITPVAISQKVVCNKYAKLYETTTDYSLWAGCYVKKDGQFLPREMFDKLLIPNAQYGNAEFNVNIK